MQAERPDVVILAAAKVGGIHANNTYPADFIYENLMIECNVIHEAFRAGVKKLLQLGSSCIYPKAVPQPMREDALLTGTLEPTNEPYAVQKLRASSSVRATTGSTGSTTARSCRPIFTGQEITSTQTTATSCPPSFAGSTRQHGMAWRSCHLGQRHPEARVLTR